MVSGTEHDSPRAPAHLVVIDGVVVGLRPLFVTKEVAAQVLGCSQSLINAYVRLRMLPVRFHGTKPVIAPSRNSRSSRPCCPQSREPSGSEQRPTWRRAL